jgi:protease YdgD
VIRALLATALLWPALLWPALVRPGTALAQPAMPGVPAADPRRAVAVEAAPWSSLVRIQSEAGGQCTGVLVAPDRVLTAAHCLLAGRTRAALRPDRVNVLAFYDRGGFRARTVAASWRTGPGFDGQAGGPRGADWAVLRLAAPLPAPALPVAAASAGMAAMLGGWQTDRAHALLADTDCRVEGALRDPGGPLLRHSCAATRGSSGGPLLVRLDGARGGGWAVAGVQVGGARGMAGGVAVPAAGLPLD